MRRLNQRGQYGAFQAILQAATIDGGANHGAAAGVGKVDAEVVYPFGVAGAVECGGGADFVGHAGGDHGGGEVFNGAASAQLFKGFAKIAFVVDQADRGLGGQRQKGGVCHGRGSAGDDRAAR